MMETRRRHGVAIDTCKGCGAVWLDGGELASLLKRYKDPEEIDSDLQVVIDFLAHLFL